MSTTMITALGKGKNSKDVGAMLAQDIKHRLGGKKPGLAYLLVSSKYELEPLLKAVREELGAVPLIGSTTAGEFTDQGVQKDSVALAVLTASDDYRFFTASATGLHDDPMGCVQQAVAAIPPQTPGYAYRSAILLHDGLAGRGEEAVLSAATILGPKVSFAGGSAGDDLAFKQTFVFCNDQITTDSVVLCVIDSKLPIGLGVKHGHKPVTEQLTVTRAKDNVLYEVNGEPAWNVWKRLLKDTAKNIGIDVDQLNDASSVGIFLIRYELGLTTGKDFKVRVPLSKNDDGSLNFACTIPEGAKFQIMESPKPEQIASAETAARNALEQVQGRKLAAALVFDCVCRGIILGDEFAKGVQAIQKVVGDIPLIGFETYGEICRRMGEASGYHNTTTVVMLLPSA